MCSARSPLPQLSRQTSPQLTQHCLMAIPSENERKAHRRPRSLLWGARPPCGNTDRVPAGFGISSQRDAAPAARALPGWSCSATRSEVSALCRNALNPSGESGGDRAGAAGTEPGPRGPRRASPGGVGRHLRADPATAAPGPAAGNPPEPGNGLGGGARGCGHSLRGRRSGGCGAGWGVRGDPRQRFCRPLSPFSPETAQEKVSHPPPALLSAGRRLPALPRSCSWGEAAFHAGRAVFLAGYQGTHNCPKDAFPSPPYEFNKEVSRLSRKTALQRQNYLADGLGAPNIFSMSTKVPPSTPNTHGLLNWPSQGIARPSVRGGF